MIGTGPTELGDAAIRSAFWGSTDQLGGSSEGQSLRAVAHHYHVGHSTIVRVLERTS